ncbi:MAG: hypothetical protein RL329_472 [Bacteroidota bacterium]
MTGQQINDNLQQTQMGQITDFCFITCVAIQRFNDSTIQRFNDSTIQRFNDSTIQIVNRSQITTFVGENLIFTLKNTGKTQFYFPNSIYKLNKLNQTLDVSV